MLSFLTLPRTGSGTTNAINDDAGGAQSGEDAASRCFKSERLQCSAESKTKAEPHGMPLVVLIHERISSLTSFLAQIVVCT